MGPDDSGIACLPMLDGYGIPAAAVDCMSAEIGVARTTYDSGIVSVVNTLAKSIGIAPGMPAKEAARMMLEAAASLHASAGGSTQSAMHPVTSTSAPEAPPRIALEEDDVRLLIIDSAGSFSTAYAGYVVVNGSHLGANTGRMAVDAGVAGRVGNDAGKGLNEAGTKGLQVLEAAGIAGATVTSRSARMGMAESTYATGIVSAVNTIARKLGISVGMAARDAALLMFKEAVRRR
jgi:uncharacterized protein YunC (DUF1805 family)